jgi:hypothetical protein
MRDDVQTVSVTVGAYLVDLYRRAQSGASFHGFEATKADTTNTSGYYRTGGLTIIDGSVRDYDGVFELPSCVVAALTQHGVDCSEVI